MAEHHRHQAAPAALNGPRIEAAEHERADERREHRPCALARIADVDRREEAAGDEDLGKPGHAATRQSEKHVTTEEDFLAPAVGSRTADRIRLTEDASQTRSG